MGGAATTPLADHAASMSPWTTQVVVDNQCTTPLRVFQARDPDEPSVDNAIDHTVPAQTAYSIHSGWIKEPLATLIMRVGVHEAKVFRMPHMTTLKVEVAASGVKVTPDDDVIVLEHPDPGSVPNNDTVPMVMKEESFMDLSASPTNAAARSMRLVVDGPRDPSNTTRVMDQISQISPWRTQIVINNQCTTPVCVYLARDPEQPAVKNAIEHTCPAQSSYPIHSGWLKEPLATVIMRVGIHEAKIFRMPHMAELKVEVAPSGLKVTSHDPMIIEDHPDPGAVPNNDTAPMVLRKESFGDRRPGSTEPRIVTHQAVVVDWQQPQPPSAADATRIDMAPPQFAAAEEEAELETEPPPTVHGRPLEAGEV